MLPVASQSSCLILQSKFCYLFIPFGELAQVFANLALDNVLIELMWGREPKAE